MLTIISDDHANHEINVQRNSNLNVFDEKKSFEALSKKLEALELDQLKLKEENSVLKSKVQSLEVNFMEVSRIEQNLSNKFSADIEKQGKDMVDKVMLKIIKSGCFNDHDQTIKEIIKDLKDLKMENQYILEVIDKLENMK